MEDGVQAMRDYLAGLDIASPEHQVLMNVTAKSEVAPSIIKENLSLHLTHTVKLDWPPESPDNQYHLNK